MRLPVILAAITATVAACDQASSTGQVPEPGPSARATAVVGSPAPSAPGSAAIAPRREARRIELVYTTTVTVPAGEGPVDLFIPIAQTDEQQTIEKVAVESTPRGDYGTEAVYGNRYWHARRARSDGKPWNVSVRYELTRRPFRTTKLPAAAPELGPAEKKKHARFLRANAKVPVGDPILDPILRDVRKNAPSGRPSEISRSIYDWVVDNIEYKKVGTGWGHGDTHWACSEKYGNCTDFHSLFISLARTESIPARFEMGLPIPEDRKEGAISGYHCWLRVYLPNVGWVPVDASEAKKHPEKRELLYGNQPADRVRFTTGRDLQLGEAHRSAPLNYFIYPHVEVAGKAWDKKLEKSFRYRELPKEAP